jgi:hypothetical protein
LDLPLTKPSGISEIWAEINQPLQSESVPF